MRIVAELPRPDCKITIFSMNMKYLVKFELGSLEQTYKVSEMDVTGGLDGVFRLLDEPFIQTVVRRFSEMNSDFADAYQRHEA
jgi:hypothetical protein